MEENLISAIKEYRRRNNLSEEFDPNDILVLSDFVEHNILFQLGQYMANARKSANLSIRELNRRSHVSIAVITDLENAKSMPRFETLIKLALALKVDLRSILLSMNLPFNFYDKSQYKIPHAESAIENIIKCNSNLVSCLGSLGYQMKQIKQILDFIGYIDYKSKN